MQNIEADKTNCYLDLGNGLNGFWNHWSKAYSICILYSIKKT